MDPSKLFVFRMILSSNFVQFSWTFSINYIDELVVPHELIELVIDYKVGYYKAIWLNQLIETRTFQKFNFIIRQTQTLLENFLIIFLVFKHHNNLNL